MNNWYSRKKVNVMNPKEDEVVEIDNGINELESQYVSC